MFREAFVYQQSTGRSGSRFLLANVNRSLFALNSVTPIDQRLKSNLVETLGCRPLDISVTNVFGRFAILMVFDTDLVNLLLNSPNLILEIYLVNVYKYPHVDFCKRCTGLNCTDDCSADPACIHCGSRSHQLANCLSNSLKCIRCSSSRNSDDSLNINAMISSVYQ